MKASKVDPPRWRETSAALNTRAADLVEAVRDVPPLPPEAMARIKTAVLARGPSRSFRGLPLGARFALVTGVLLASIATAGATMILWRRHVMPPAAPRTAVQHSVPAARSGPHQQQAKAAPLTSAPTPAQAPRPSAPPARRSAMASAPEVRASKEAAKEAAPSSETEARLLARVLSRLRQDHDAAGALSLLDEYARAFPDGILEAEAFAARLEAVIQLDDRRTALHLLDDRSTFTGRLGRQQLLTRAELRASASRYADALGDFDRLLTQQGVSVPAELERVLYGRAVCLGRLGRHDRARADLTAYAERFPQGKFAAEVARLLAGTLLERRP